MVGVINNTGEYRYTTSYIPCKQSGSYYKIENKYKYIPRPAQTSIFRPKGRHTSIGKKLKGQEGEGPRQHFCPPGPDPNTEREQEKTGSGNEGETKQRRKELDHHQRKDCHTRGGGRAARLDTSKLKCFYTNANSVVGKIQELRQRIDGRDIVGIVESWATNKINDAELSIDGYNMYRLDRGNKKGGGLILFINDRIRSSLCTGMMSGGFEESIWCNVDTDAGRILIGMCYRSPAQ